MKRERFGKLRLVAAKQSADLRAEQDSGEGAGQTPLEEVPAESSKRRSPVAVWRRTPLRARLALAATIAVAAGVGGGVGFAYVAVRHSLTQQIDDALLKQGMRMQAQQTHPRTGVQRSGDKIWPYDSTPQVGETRLNFQFINSKGAPLVPIHPTPRTGTPTSTVTNAAAAYPALPQPLPVTPQDIQVANGTLVSFIRSTQWAGQHVRILTLQIGGGHAMQIESPLTTIDQQLPTLGWQLFGAGAAGIVLAAGLGWLVTRTALRPVAELTSTAERIASTHDLAHRIAINGSPGEPATNSAGWRPPSTHARRGPGGHRPPAPTGRRRLPRTAHPADLAAHQRRGAGQARPAGPERPRARWSQHHVRPGRPDRLVGDTVELARGEEQRGPVRGAPLRPAGPALHRPRDRPHWPKAVFKADLDEAVVYGVTDRLAKAVGNLLDNAAKFSPDGGLVEVRPGPPPTARSPSATTAPASRKPTSRTSSTASTAPPRRATSPAPAWDWR